MARTHRDVTGHRRALRAAGIAALLLALMPRPAAAQQRVPPLLPVTPPGSPDRAHRAAHPDASRARIARAERHLPLPADALRILRLASPLQRAASSVGAVASALVLASGRATCASPSPFDPLSGLAATGSGGPRSAGVARAAERPSAARGRLAPSHVGVRSPARPRLGRCDRLGGARGSQAGHRGGRSHHRSGRGRLGDGSRRAPPFGLKRRCRLAALCARAPGCFEPRASACRARPTVFGYGSTSKQNSAGRAAIARDTRCGGTRGP